MKIPKFLLFLLFVSSNTTFFSQSNRLWATYHGAAGLDMPHGVATDQQSNVVMVGQTQCSIGIATTGAHQTVFGGGLNDAFITKYDSTGNKLWSTYYGAG